MILFFIEHKRGNGPTSVGAVTGLATDTNSSLADAVLVLSARDSARRRRHWIVVMRVRSNWSG